MRLLSILIFLALMQTACVTTSVRDFTDPGYTTYRAGHMMIGLPNASLQIVSIFDETFKDELSNVDVRVSHLHDLFPPTRRYSNDDMNRVMQDRHIDSYLVITLGDSAAESEVVGYHTTTNAYSYGGYGSASTYATPVTVFSRDTTAKATLYDSATGAVIWMGDISTAARGALFMSMEQTVESMVEEVVDRLVERGHLARR